jgi:Domain of unknown function (DUF6429)
MPEGAGSYVKGIFCAFWARSTALTAMIGHMEIIADRIDDTVLGLLWLTLHDERRAWKSHDWDALNRLHEQGLIHDPVNKAKSVVLTDKSLERAEDVCRALFA